MMMRLTLIVRLTLIAVVAFGAVWIILIALIYRTSLAENLSVLPTPAGLAAITEAIEHASKAQRSQLIQAISSSRLTLRIDRGKSVSSMDQTNGSMQAAYANSLDGRPLRIVEADRPHDAQWLPRLSRATWRSVEFSIGLKTGENLIVDAQEELMVTPLGLPIGFGAGLSGTLIALLALLVMQRETRALARLAAAADAMDLSGKQVPLPLTKRNAPEIRSVVNAFDRMQARLAELLTTRMTLVGGIAHDVRTFATRLRLRIDNIPDGIERQRAIGDIDTMIRLLDDALLASRTGARKTVEELINMHELVAAEVSDRQMQGEAVQYFGPQAEVGEILVLGDPLALRRIIANLIDNAIKYGETARISLNREGQLAVFMIDDDGPGIPPEKSRSMLEPFTRLDSSRNRKTGGAGLGLAIARTLTEEHGGTIEIDDVSSGARLILRLPVF